MDALSETNLIDSEDGFVGEVIGNGYGEHTDDADEHQNAAHRVDETHFAPGMEEHLDHRDEGRGYANTGLGIGAASLDVLPPPLEMRGS